MIGLAKIENGKVVLSEGGRMAGKDIKEEEIARISDEQLKTMRKAFVSARMKSQKTLSQIDDSKKFSTPEGQQAYADVEYYSGLIRRIEYEMQSRFLTLD